MKKMNLNNRYTRKKLWIATILLPVVLLGFNVPDEFFRISKNLDIFSSMFRELNLYYVDSVDADKIMKKSMDDMLAGLDPYTTYIPEEEMSDYRYITTGHYGGIGAVIRQKADYVVISDPYEGFPAQKSGLLAGDMILEVEGVSMKGKKTDEVSRILKGSPGTDVHLTMQHAGENDTFKITLKREEIIVKPVPYSAVLKDDIGYIKLNSFTDKSSRDVASALKELQEKNPLKGLVLDLRGNPGGLLYEAVNLSNVFVRKGETIVTTKGRAKDADRAYPATNDALDEKIPLVVIVNSGSASASEIVSGSLQDLDRAVILGQRTFGKGLVQTTRSLPYNAQLKITTAKYYTPSGRCIQALDYSHRNEDGSVGKIPDSLMKAFKTKSGRLVYDGGGVLPDVLIPQEKLNNILQSLLAKNLIFDFATVFYRQHSSPASMQVSDDSLFNAFQNFLSGKDYDYTTASEKSLDELQKKLVEENYYEKLGADVERFKSRLSHNKQEDLTKSRREILGLLREEIASRYYFQKGRIEASLKNDPELDSAMSLLKNQESYNSVLSAKITSAPAGNSTRKK